MASIYLRLMGFVFSVFALTMLMQGRAAGQAIDEILEQAGNTGAGRQRTVLAQQRASKIGRGARITPDGKTVITELDKANPVPQQDEDFEVTANTRRTRGRDTVRPAGRRPPPPRRGRNKRRRGKRNALADRNRYWNSKRIPYVISGNFTPSELNVIQESIDEYNIYTCLRFVPWQNENNYIDIIRDGGCWSWVGQIGDRQEMSLDIGCAYSKKVPIHEMLHALGVYHQQSRADRDGYVRIHPENIPDHLEFNFRKRTPPQVTVYNTPYSYLSVMHYSRTAFSSNGQNTITTIDPAFIDKIGRGSTFSYEDLLLLHEMYQCTGHCPSITCPPNSYQGSDCTCHCRNPTNPDVPVVKNCAGVCLEPDVDCSCNRRANACSEVSNSSCNTRTGECQCKSGYASHHGICTPISEINCYRLGDDCKCSFDNSKCPAAVANSVCNTASNTCECPSGYYASESTLECIKIVPCTEANVPCACSKKGAIGCDGVPNSSCDTKSDTCKCNEDYYPSNRVCVAAPACTVLNRHCRCSVQGADACNAIPNSACDTATERCVCDPGTHREERGRCVRTNRLLSDGSRLHPFRTSHISTTSFVPTQGSDASSFGVPSNGWYLFASGNRNGDQAAFESDWLTVPGRYCVSYSARLTNAKIYTEYTYDGVRYGYRSYTVRDEMDYFYDIEYNRNTPDRIKFRIRAEPLFSGNWLASVDPVKIELCQPGTRSG